MDPIGFEPIIPICKTGVIPSCNYGPKFNTKIYS